MEQGTILRIAAGLLLGSLPACADLLISPNNICSNNLDGSGSFAACGNNSPINQAYGDTAAVNVTYMDKIHQGDSLRWWGIGYSNLPSAVWGGIDDATGDSWDRIELDPLGGLSVTLDSFDLGTFPFCPEDHASTDSGCPDECRAVGLRRPAHWLRRGGGTLHARRQFRGWNRHRMEGYRL